jgi:hypothetical protein
LSCRALLGAAIAILIAFSGATLRAQQVTGTITGTVTDPSGATIVGAEVSVHETNTGLVRASQTNEQGNFRFLLLPVGVYSVEVASAGFKGFRREGIVMEADRSLAVPVVLELGAVTEVVEVVASTPLLEPNTSALGTVMDKMKVDDLPLNGRNPMGLANLVPTVRGIGYFGGQVLSSWRLSAVSIGGGPPLHNGFMVDGIAATKAFTSGTQNFPTVESTQEFKILTNAMSAEFGRTAGGIVSVVTKSGTNEFHGNLFEYLRNDNLNANGFFSNKAGAERPTLAWNQFGGSVGGPVVRDKLFFFANYEAFRERRATQQIRTSPTGIERSGDFSDTRNQAGNVIQIYDPFTTQANPDAAGKFIRQPFANNVIPQSRINAVPSNVLTYYPAPNLAGQTFTRAQNLFLQGPGPIDRNTFTVKMDYNLASSRRISGRFTYDDLNWQFPLLFGTPAEADGRAVLIPRNSASLNYTDSLTPTLLLDVKAGYNRENEHFFTPSQGFDIASLGFPSDFAQESSVSLGARFPRFAVGDMSTFGGLGSRGNPSLTTLESANLTKVSGTHTVKFGAEHRFYARNDWGRENSAGSFSFNRVFTQGPDPLTASSTAGYGVASFLLGTPASGSARLETDRAASVRYYALFVQDDWKVTSNLTLNLGLRWDYESPVTDRFNILTNFDPTLDSPLGMNLRGGLVYPGTGNLSRNHTEPDYNDFGPRFGFAYRFRDRMVVRGGYGIMYIPTTPSGGPTITGFQQNTPMVSTLDGGLTPNDLLTDPFPDGLQQPNGANEGALTGIGTSVAGQLRDVKRGYSQQWNFTLQYEPWNSWLFEAAWVGNKGTRLQGNSRQLNIISNEAFQQGTALAQSVPNPFQGTIETGALSGPTITRFQSLMPFPQYTGVNGGYSFLHNSIYHALAVKVEKRFSQGFSFLLAYTKSKLIDDGNNSGQIRPGGNSISTIQNWLDLSAERSKSAEDIPQRMVLSALWELPFGRNSSGLTRQVIAGWHLNAINTIESGYPVSLSASITGPGNRPNVVPGEQAKIDNPTIDRWFNQDAFSTPGGYTYGNVSRTLPNVHSDSVFNLDLSLFKDFFINERAKVQFRAEAFNLTNTPTFEAPGRSVNSATFGVVTATAFNPKPREFQFALKFIF